MSMSNNQAVVDFDVTQENNDDGPLAITDDEVGSFGGQKRRLATVIAMEKPKAFNQPSQVELKVGETKDREASNELGALGAGLLTSSNSKS